ncbi:hypothetical protein [Ectopseudomonas khazarica]|uniref:hypothetical protein n=1 Tax=Ectopseudomonas khazarica TaxID=2502979 RepID=UPI003B923517
MTRPKKYMLIQFPSWAVWVLVVLSVITGTANLARTVAGWYQHQDQSTASEQCRQIVKGTIGIELSEGVLCVRPVHFIGQGVGHE